MLQQGSIATPFPQPGRAVAEWPIFVGVLGDFRLLRAGRTVQAVSGGKLEILVALLAHRSGERVARDTLLAVLWPDVDPALARQSLNSLVYTLRRHLSGALGGAAPIECVDNFYRLNVAAGIGVDLALYADLVARGDTERHAHDLPRARSSYTQALRLYRGDLWGCSDVHAMMERERLRASYLTLLAWMADDAYASHDYATCRKYCSHLLIGDPHREDAHRLVMRCCVRMGERAQALHQYQVCARLLRTAFDADPEPATTALYEQVRLHPDAV